ncbi:hypothetical protein DPV78_002255 [Talaromyces pinophilus]|nr:hypothetical protein DPV78_002255 [Talaromyces pinophilus]
MAMYDTVIHRGVPWLGEIFVRAGVTQGLAETAHMLDLGIFDGIALSPVPDRQNIEQTGQNYVWL